MFKEESLDNNTCGEKGIKLKEENYIDITDDSEDENNINKNEIINIKINKLKKPSTKTKKIIEEKAYNKTKDLLNKKRKRQISKKINFGLEFKLFYKLVDKYGIDKVLSSLFNKDIYSMNEIDKVINEINDTCGKEKFISNIIKTYYNCLKDYISSNPEPQPPTFPLRHRHQCFLEQRIDKTSLSILFDSCRPAFLKGTHVGSSQAAV